MQHIFAALPIHLAEAKISQYPKACLFLFFRRRDEGCYVARSQRTSGILTDKLFRIPVAHFDTVVIERLQALESADNNMKDRVKIALEQVYAQQSEDFVNIHEQLKGLELQLSENAEKRLVTSSKDPLYTKRQAQADELLQTKEQLEMTKEKLVSVQGL